MVVGRYESLADSADAGRPKQTVIGFAGRGAHAAVVLLLARAHSISGSDGLRCPLRVSRSGAILSGVRDDASGYPEYACLAISFLPED
jgi:hypothetical protein